MSAAPAGLLCADRGVPLYGPSGASAHLRGIADALAQQHGVLIGVSGLTDRRGAAVPAPPHPTTIVPRRRWGWVPQRWRDRGAAWDAARLARVCDETWPSIRLVWERHSGLSCAGRLLAERRACPLVLEVNAPLSLERPGRIYRPERYAREEAELLRQADRVLVVSPWLMDWVVQQGCHPDRVHWVPNGTSTPERGEREATRDALGLRGLVLGLVGSMRPWHGVELLPRLLEELPEATCLLIGERHGGTLPVHPRLRHLGQLQGQALADAISAMDVGLLPYPDGAPPWFDPLKLWDYRAQGVAVVGTDVPALRESLQQERGEVLARPDPPSLALAVRRAHGHRPIRWVRSWSQVTAEALAGLS